MNPHDDLEAYVLGALDRDEVARFEAHLAACEACREGIASYSTVMRSLRSLPHVAPPAVPVVRPRAMPWGRAIAAALLIGTGVAVGAAIDRSDGDESAIVAMIADRPREVALLGASASGRAVVGAQRRRTAFVVRGLPQPPAGRDYQVWIKGDRIASPGLLHRTRAGLEVLVVDGDRIAGAHHIGVTLEPAGGSPRRTGPVEVEGDV